MTDKDKNIPEEKLLDNVDIDTKDVSDNDETNESDTIEEVTKDTDNNENDEKTIDNENEEIADLQSLISEEVDLLEDTDSQIDTDSENELTNTDNEMVTLEQSEPSFEEKAKEDVPVKKSKKRAFIYISLIVLACAAAVYIYNYLQVKKYEKLLNVDTYYDGIYVDGMHLGGLTRDEAYKKITDIQKDSEAEIRVKIIYNEHAYSFEADDIDIIYDTDVILTKAYDVGRSGTLKERYFEVIALPENAVKFNTNRTEDPSQLKAKIDEIALSIEKQAIEPSVEFTPDKNNDKTQWFSYVNPIPGINVDEEKLWSMVEAEFANRTYGEVNVPTNEILPELNVDLRDLTKEIVSFKSIQARNSNREHNIALCCSLINGTVLMPGEEFSMNNTTGERTKEKGFLEANTIVGGNELVPGIAGGVCQVSGTLFNAAIRADLEITERYHHSFELGYLPRGRDATVNYGTADLKFVNNQDTPIYIAMYTKGLEVYADIFGAPLNNCAYIDMWVKTIKTTPIGEPIIVKDKTVPKGSEPKVLKGHTGIVCEAYKIYRNEDGEQIASELMYTDTYKYYAPEIHIHPDDYDAYVNPTQKPNDNSNTSPAA